MRTMLARVDAWCRTGDFTVEDIAWFRIIFSVGLLLTIQQIGWISSLPAEQFDPPPGPMILVDAMPPHAVLEGLEIVTAVLAALLLVGLHTRTVSILLALALMTGFGLVYSLGKIDHTIVLVLVPAAMAFSGWGQAMSVDATGQRRPTDRSEVAQWPLRLLAVMIALSFVTAGWAKLRSGWLDFDTHAVNGHFVRGYFSGGRTDWLAPHVIELQPGRLWEVADWFTLALELGLVLTVFSWRWFRAAIAVAALFHLGVLLLMNIVFSWNIFGYGAFVRWSAILPSSVLDVRLSRSLGYVAALAVGLAAYALHEALGPDFQLHTRTAIVFLGGGLGAAYLMTRMARARSGSRLRPA